MSSFSIPGGQVDVVVMDLERDASAVAQLREGLGKALGGVLTAAVALVDPAMVLVGGPWGNHPGVLAGLARELAEAPRPVQVEAAAIEDDPAMSGARETALQQLRDAIVAGVPRLPGFDGHRVEPNHQRSLESRPTL